MQEVYTAKGRRHTATATGLWEHIFGSQRGLLQIWTGVRGADGKIAKKTIVSKYFNYPKEAQTAANWALERATEGWEVFFCTHLLREARRIKENASEVISL